MDAQKQEEGDGSPPPPEDPVRLYALAALSGFALAVAIAASFGSVLA